MRKPNLFIIGAPKCGTTSLHRYLADHPNVFMSEPKEPGFWSEDFPDHRRVTRIQEYLDLFCEAQDHHMCLGESTAIYIYSRSALEAIRDFNPEARIIVMFRNPVDQAYSYHGEKCYNGNENVDDFMEAWRLQPSRRRGESLPPRCEDPALLQYARNAMFGHWYQQVREVFTAEQHHVILLDDMKANMSGVWSELLKFLGLPDDNREEFPRENPHARHRIPCLGRLLKRPPRWALAVNRGLKKCLGLRRTGLSDILVSRKGRPPLSPAFRKELAETFHDDIQLLESLLNRDLSHWTADA